jgi:hypothetical protein
MTFMKIKPPGFPFSRGGHSHSWNDIHHFYIFSGIFSLTFILSPRERESKIKSSPPGERRIKNKILFAKGAGNRE